VDKINKADYIKYILELLDHKHEDYKTDLVINIYFKYINVLANDSNKTINIDTNYYNSKKPKDYYKVRMTSINGFNLPTNISYDKWGSVISKSNRLLIIKYNESIMTVDLNTYEINLLKGT
jgi:hypothetical protein